MPIILPFTPPSAPGVTSAFTEWYKDVMPECAGLPLDYALHIIRNTAIDFCTRTWVFQTPITGDMVASTASYTLTPPDQTEFTGLVWVKNQRDLTGEEVEAKTASAKDVATAPSSSGAPTRYTRTGLTNLTFYSTPDAAYTFTAQMALRPLRDASTIDSEVFTRHRQGIAHGALMTLLAMINKPWTNPSAAAMHGAEYMRAIRNAKIDLEQYYTGESGMVDLNGGVF